MLIVISNPTTKKNEAHLINALFDEGLEVLHLRKPEANIDELGQLLREIKACHHPKIALHHCHSLAKEFGIKRLHFPEVKRKATSEEELVQLKKPNVILSTSIHQIEAYKTLSTCFSYTFFGPVFNSISKQGYSSTLADGFTFPVEKNNLEVIALGGVDSTNIATAMKMRFDGVAVLGAIWKSPNESIAVFKDLKKALE
jgi:thiamine-phosphate pyrophosphorylase